MFWYFSKHPWLICYTFPFLVSIRKTLSLISQLFVALFRCRCCFSFRLLNSTIVFLAKSYTVFSRVYTNFKNNFPWKLFNFNPKTVLLLIYDFICKTTLCSKCFTIGKRSFIAAYCRLECDQPIQVFLLVFVNISETALQKVFLVREKVFWKYEANLQENCHACKFAAYFQNTFL